MGPNDPLLITQILANEGAQWSNNTNSFFIASMYEELPKSKPLRANVEYYQPGYGRQAVAHVKVIIVRLESS